MATSGNGAAELPEWGAGADDLDLDLDNQLREVEARGSRERGRARRDALPPPAPVPGVIPVMPYAWREPGSAGGGRGVTDTQPTGAPVALQLGGVTDSLNEHDERIDQIETWIESTTQLAKQGKWLIGILISALIGLGTWGVSTTIRLEERSAVALERLVDLTGRARERDREIASVKEALVRIEAQGLAADMHRQARRVESERADRSAEHEVEASVEGDRERH